MTLEELREQQIANIAGMLRQLPFTFEMKVVKKPTGIKIIYEVTQEQMDEIIQKSKEKGGEI